MEGNEKEESLQVLEVSEELKKYLNLKMLFKEKGNIDITDKDVDKVIERIQKINQGRTNKMLISANFATEFIDLLKEKVKKQNVDLGIIEIDIADKNFSIKNFVENAKDISYSLCLRIKSIDDLKEDEKSFLESRYGITYIYAGNQYHIDELYSVIRKMKSLILENEIKGEEKDVKRAQSIADTIFKQFKLYVPSEYRPEEKEIILRNGERLPLPNFRVLEDTSHFADLTNIFEKKIADFTGMRKLCKECLRVDGYEMVERVSVVGNMVGTEFIVNNQEFGIDVTKEGIKIVEVS